LVTVDNPQLNTLTAHGPNRFYAILTNQNDRPEAANVRFDAKALNFDPTATPTITAIAQDGNRSPLPLTNGTARLEIPAKGLAVLVLEGVKVDLPAHRKSPEAPQPGMPRLTLNAGGTTQVRAAAIPGVPGIAGWDAYVWCTATPTDAREVTFRYRVGDGAWQETRDAEYPFELSVPVEDRKSGFEFQVEVQSARDSRAKTEVGKLTATPIAP
jgi:hypothetical protein